jgi:hypothetical protein
MAEQRSNCLSGCLLGNVWAGWLTFALIAMLFRGNILRADSVPSNSPASNASVAVLEYQEKKSGVINWTVSVTTQITPFKKEPAPASGKIVRGVLEIGANSSNAIPFLWQRDPGKLYLDLNRNQDLTDDPSGVFLSRKENGVYYQTFANVHLVLETTFGRCPVLADLTFWDNGSEPNCHLWVRSLWQGKLTLQGRDWQVGIVQNVLNESGSFENSRLVLRPWEKRDQPYSIYDGSLASVRFSRNVFLNGHAYQLEWLARSQNGEPKPVLQFTEQSVPLGKLNLPGQDIRRLVLSGGPYRVILDQPSAVVKIPTGNYSEPEILLETNGATAFSTADVSHCDKQVSINDKTPAILNVGGPLTNSVIATGHGRDLRLDYRLVGIGGEMYQRTFQNRSKPPSFAVYQGAKKIASGTFEFG